MEIVAQNLRSAARALQRAPGFTVVAILTLTLGIGANVAIYSVVHGVLLTPLPFTHPEQLVRVYDDLRASNARDVGMSVPELWDLRDKSGVFRDISVTIPVDANLTGVEHPDRVELLGTNTSYFTLLGVNAALGRVYNASDSVPGFTEGIVISDGFWHRMFGADPNIVGKKIRLDGDLSSIWGVLPAGFHYPGRAVGRSEIDVYTAAGYNANPFPTPPPRGARYLPGAIARLKPEITIAQAQARLDAFTAQLSREYPVDYPASVKWGVRLVQIQDDWVGKVQTELLVLFGAVGCVLLIACVNLANLLLARSASRRREMAIRQTLGAGRGRLVAQLLTESLFLAMVSGAAALIMVVAFRSWLLRLAPADLPRLDQVSLSPGVLLFGFLISISTGVIFGLAPLLDAWRPDQAASFREGARGSGTSKQHMRISRTLVACEIALSLVLLIGTGLLLRSFRQMLEVRPGFDPHGLLTAKLWMAVPNEPDEDHYFTVEKRAAFHKEVLRRIRAVPGVQAAALGNSATLPMSDQRLQLRFVIEGAAVDLESAPVAEVSSVSIGFFDALKIPTIAGRAFRDSDDAQGQQVAIVNQALAREYFAGADVVGKAFKFADEGAVTVGNALGVPQQLIHIVGVVADTKSDGLDALAAPRIFRPMNQLPTYDAVIYLRSPLDAGFLGGMVRAQVQSVDPSIPVFSVRSMDQILAAYMRQRRFALELLGTFAAVALLLASVGIYGVMAYAFSRRTNEIGIRMAMGAQPGDILKIVISEGLSIIAFGLSTGLLGSLLLTRFLQTMLFNVKPVDPVTFAAISALLAAVTLGACLVPARRASRVDPLVALRHE